MNTVVQCIRKIAAFILGINCLLQLKLELQQNGAISLKKCCTKVTIVIERKTKNKFIAIYAVASYFSGTIIANTF
jgi:hypothetical protein